MGERAMDTSLPASGISSSPARYAALKVARRGEAGAQWDRVTSDQAGRYIFRKPAGSPADRGAPPPRYRRELAGGMIIERDVAVPVRGGVTVYADVFRPADERPTPPRKPGAATT
jgi:predicted acyl esterase